MQRVQEYIDWVHDNPRMVCKWVKLAIKRFQSDLKKSESEDYPYRFDERKASRFIRFTELLKQYKDVWAGKPLHLEPWQVFIFANIYGWVRKDNGLRRFRKSFVFCARKQGKSTMVSSVLLYDLLTTPGAEAFCAATKREQSKIVWESVAQMIRQNEDLKEMLQVYKSTSTIVNPLNAGKLEALSSEADTFDGLNPSSATIDEVAAMKTYDIIQVLQSGTASRPEPLLFEITSGSDNSTSAGALEKERAEKILEGVYEDDSFFCMLFTLDKGDLWTNERNWIKANPNLGVSVKLETLRHLCTEAQQTPELEAEFRIKNLSQFISPVTAWISYQKWKLCIDNAKKWRLEDLDMSECVAIGAVDLSQRVDFTSFDVMVYHLPTQRYYSIHNFYIPNEQIQERCKTDSPLIYKWIEQKLITATPGPIVNYGIMFDDIKEAIDKYNIKEILYDPWNAGQLIDQIGPLVDLVEIKQNMRSISPYAKDYEASIFNGQVVDGNPVMAWMISNCDVYTDANSNIKPVKHSKNHHIDGVITSLMSLGRIKSLVDGGYIDTRTPEQIEADMTERLSELEY